MPAVILIHGGGWVFGSVGESWRHPIVCYLSLNEMTLQLLLKVQLQNGAVNSIIMKANCVSVHGATVEGQVVTENLCISPPKLSTSRCLICYSFVM